MRRLLLRGPLLAGRLVVCAVFALVAGCGDTGPSLGEPSTLDVAMPVTLPPCLDGAWGSDLWITGSTVIAQGRFSMDDLATWQYLPGRLRYWTVASIAFMDAASGVATRGDGRLVAFDLEADTVRELPIDGEPPQAAALDGTRLYAVRLSPPPDAERQDAATDVRVYEIDLEAPNGEWQPWTTSAVVDGGTTVEPSIHARGGRVVVSTGSAVVSSIDRGATWQTMDVPSPAHDEDAAARLLLAEGDAIVLARESSAVATDDAGVTWRDLDPGVGVRWDLMTVGAAGDLVLPDARLRSFDGGRSWERFFDDRAPGRLAWPVGDAVYLSAPDAPLIVATPDGRVDLPGLYGPSTYRRLDNTVALSGGDYLTTCGYSQLRWSAEHETWTWERDLPVFGRLRPVGVDALAIEARTLDGPPTAIVSLSFDAGASWSRPSAVQSGDVRLRDVARLVALPDRVIVSGTSDDVECYHATFESFDAGATWTRIPPDAPVAGRSFDREVFLEHVPTVATSDGTLFAASFAMTPSPFEKCWESDAWISRSTDAGRSWVAWEDDDRALRLPLAVGVHDVVLRASGYFPRGPRQSDRLRLFLGRSNGERVDELSELSCGGYACLPYLNSIWTLTAQVTDDGRVCVSQDTTGLLCSVDSVR